MDQESGFIVEPQLDGSLAGLQLVHRSETGFAEIWRATKFSQFVVLKALKEEYREDAVYEALLRKEFEIGYSLNHPAVCRTWHFRDHPLLGHCIEMEWVDGVPLDQRFSTALPDEELFRKIAAELCDALAYLHSRQVIHRDIKPSNILITHNGDNVKLIDFGLSDSDDSAVLKMAAGTKDHIAPEVLEGRPADVRTDIWAVGKVLSGLTRGHRRALRKATAPDPARRYPHIGAFKKALLGRTTSAWLYIVIALAAGLGAFGLALWNRPVTAGDVVPAADSVVVVETAGALESAAAGATDAPLTETSPAPARRAGRPASSGAAANGPAANEPAPQGQATQEDINDLFRQATDLFE